jgi:hydroxypyruvate isomerase
MSDFQLSASIDMLFTDGALALPDRVRAAAAAGCEGIEIGLWRNKPLDEITEAVAESHVTVVMMIIEPQIRIVDPDCRSEFLAAIQESTAAASRVGCRTLMAASGETLPGVRAADQDDAIVSALRAAAPIAAEHGVKLLLEPLNTRRDHQGMYLSSTALGLDLVERVDRPEVGLLYDIYHSAMMGEEPVAVLGGRADLVDHVHVADTNGRHEPGTGTIDWPTAMTGLRNVGYDGFVGLEYIPTVESATSMRSFCSIIEAVKGSSG